MARRSNRRRSEVALGTSAAISLASPWLRLAGLCVRQFAFHPLG
jgi:hypothetical protein